MEKFIGVSLIFYKKDKYKKFRAVQSSYIFELKPLEQLLEDINHKAEAIINGFLLNFEYLGISDIYITESLGIYNYLGRTSFFELKNETDRDEIILSDDEINKKVSEIVQNSLINVGFVYFNRDSEGPNFNSTIIVYTIVDDFISLNELYKIAESNDFKSKIVKFSIEKLRKEDLLFKGISDFYSVRNEGLFEVEGVFDKKEEIITDVLSNKQFEKELDSINEDYKYIY